VHELFGVIAAFDAILHSVWLLPVLVVLIAVDGPFPVLPSETLLMSAAAAAFGTHDLPAVAGLFFASLLGSLVGDVLVYSLGRSSNRILRGAEKDCGLGAWVRRNLHSRPEMSLVGARLVPGGRLVSTAAAGRVQLPMRRFLPATAASSAVWSVYMLLIGLVLGPMTGGNPLLCLGAGIVMAILTGGGFELARRIRGVVRRRRGLERELAAVTAAGTEAALAGR
jgi:membrane protein DedA with SNARE-associated domain